MRHALGQPRSMAGFETIPSPVKIYLDGERVPVSDFKSYVDLYIGTKGAAIEM